MPSSSLTSISAEKSLLSTRVRDLLDSPTWQSLSVSKQPDLLQKMNMVEDIGAPPMRLISSDTLREYGYFPRMSMSTSTSNVIESDDGTMATATMTTIDARQALVGGGAVLIFLSHRWLRAKHPDDEQGTKFRALINWSNWYENVYSTSNTRKLYFWIDWCCMDQDNHDGALERGVQSLPLYVSLCNDFLCYETVDYYDRAWCVLERVIAYAFTFAGKLPWVINQEFARATVPVPEPGVTKTRSSKTTIYYKPVERILTDPREGKCLCQEDRKFHQVLTKCALTSKAWTGGDGRMLHFGKTVVMAQVMCFDDG